MTHAAFAPNRATSGGERDSASTARIVLAAVVLLGIGLRLAFAPQFSGVDDAGYLDAARRVSLGLGLEEMFPLFRFRVGMAYPLGWCIRLGLLQPAQFWVLTLLADVATVACLFAIGRRLAGTLLGLLAAIIYATYPLAVQRAMMYYPFCFQAASIAAGALCLIAADRTIHGRKARLLALLGGILIGVGYLVKEDTALAIPALAIGALAAGRHRWDVVAAFCIGGAAVFAAETGAYWYVTGSALARLAGTSGMGAPIADSLYGAQVWSWDAYVRSLLFIPSSVGILWWLAIVASVMMWRSRIPDLRAIIVALVLLMVYLQFGSTSIREYVPLPKQARYTAIATPFVVIVVGAWISRLLISRPRRAVAVIGVTLILNVPCIVYLSLSSSERMRNVLAAQEPLSSFEQPRVYTDFYAARLLTLLSPPGVDVRVWYHADFAANHMTVTSDPDSDPGAYVLLDRQSSKIYTSSYEMSLPSSVRGRNHWRPLWRHSAYGERGPAAALLRGLRTAAARWAPEPLSRRITRNIDDMILHDDAVIYRIPFRGELSSYSDGMYPMSKGSLPQFGRSDKD